MLLLFLFLWFWKIDRLTIFWDLFGWLYPVLPPLSAVFSKIFGDWFWIRSSQFSDFFMWLVFLFGNCQEVFVFFEFNALSRLFVFILLSVFSIIWYYFDSFDGVGKRLVKFFLIVMELSLFLAFWTSNLFIFFFFYQLALFAFLRLLWFDETCSLRALRRFSFYMAASGIFFLMGVFFLYYAMSVAFVYPRSPVPVWLFWDIFSAFLRAPANLCYLIVQHDPSCIIYVRFGIFFIFLSFCVLLPIFPFQFWLLETLVEAPALLSIIMASILLKIGCYGIFRFMPAFIYCFVKHDFIFYSFIVLATLGFLIPLFLSCMKPDLKWILANLCFSQMNLFLLLVFAEFLMLSLKGGSLFLAVSHSYIIAGSFFLVEFMYIRFYSRDFKFTCLLWKFSPLFFGLFVIFFILNLNLGSPFGIFTECLGVDAICKGLLEFQTIFLYSSAFSFFALFQVFLAMYYPEKLHLPAKYPEFYAFEFMLLFLLLVFFLSGIFYPSLFYLWL